MSEQGTIAVIGAGVVGTAVAFALARDGRRVLLLDRAEPGIAGASFGNAGHIATEVVQPLPSPGLLFGFWRELFCFGGALDLPAGQVLRMLPWIGGFAAAAFRRGENTRHLAPLVLTASSRWSRWLREMGRPDLLRQHGHFEIELGRQAETRMLANARAMARVGVRTSRMPGDQLLPLQRAANARSAAGLWFPDSAHVIDPLEAVRAFAAAAVARNAQIRRLEVRALRTRGDEIEIISEEQPLLVDAAVVCAGVEAAPLLAAFGLRAPLQAVRGYHIELPGHLPFLDAPVVYNREHIIVTAMAGRLRASSYMEFNSADAPADPRKPQRLRQGLSTLGYDCREAGMSWLGSRPVLPDYLPGIGRAHGAANLFYAIGNQHIGLTTAPATADLIADIVAQRPPHIPIAAFDLKRFNAVTLP
jgi:glycine/D-amino acid oxidase-like deaminating enzyme